MFDRIVSLFDDSDCQQIDDNFIMHHRFTEDDDDEDYALAVEYPEDYWVYFTKEQVNHAVEVSPGKFNIMGNNGEFYDLAFYAMIPYNGDKTNV